MRYIDVFNGDADGICALHQLRLAEPAETVLVTGPKRDIALVERVAASPGDAVTVLDVSVDRNRAALERLLARGVRVRWFDHHFPGEIPSHPLFEAHIETASNVCTSILVDRHLGGRYRAWAVVAAFGDNLADSASAIAAPLGLDGPSLDRLRDLGESVNYNAYGESEADLIIPPVELYRLIRPYADPLEFIAREGVAAQLDEGRRTDLAAAAAVPPYRAAKYSAAYLLPDAPWARRVIGAFANRLAAADRYRAYAVAVPNSRGGYTVSVRASGAGPRSADALCRAYPTGGGRQGAAGIDHLPPERLEEFIARLEASAS
jgi:single-stranded DNA-specific DHH superfamily exonuclease